MNYDVVIMAGGVNSGELRKYAPYESEALIIIGNYPMILYVYEAVKRSNKVGNIIISGPDSLRELFKKEENLVFTPPGEDPLESLSNALNTVGVANLSEKVLVLPTDIPFITPEAIDDFIDRTEQFEADFYYAIVRKEVNEARFPGVIRTYVNIKEGTFTGGNLFVIRTPIVNQCIELGKKLVQKRKNPLAQAKLFGMKLVFKFITRQLSIADAEQRFSEILGISGRAVVSPYAEVGVDVDKPSDLKLAEQYLGKK
ncbi:MAG: NTP transferase domain-containing protein [Chitinophagales bacterium]